MASRMIDARVIRNDALALPRPARALLAQELLESLDQAGDSAEIEALWSEEAERRYAEIKSGKVECVPGEDVLRRVRNRKK